MMTFSPKTRRSFRRSSERKRRFKIGGLIVLALVSVFFLSGILGNVASYATAPLRSLGNWFTTSSAAIPSYFRDRDSLVAQLDMLRNELKNTDGVSEQVENLREENNRLRELLGVSESPKIAAGVVMRPGDTPYDTLLIDKGSRDGITEGALVFAGANVVVGTVRRVFPNSALVSLVSSPGEESTVYIYGPDIFTRAEGMGGGVLRVSVPQGITLEAGNLVVLPTVASGLYGIISHIESLESSPAQYGFVTSPVSINSLRFVAVSTDVPPTITFEDALRHVESMRGSIFTAPIPQEVLISTTSTTTSDISKESE